MSEPGRGARVLAIAVAAALMLTGVVVVGRRLASGGEGPSAGLPAGPLTAPVRPIAAEADVFRTRAADQAEYAALTLRPTAHPRTLSMYRAVRAYPGAPPRVPHGLTPVELRTGACGTCHERGGFAPRFGLYAPLTPHPQYGSCLQCHVPVDDLMHPPAGPVGAGGETCVQCHRLEGRTSEFAALDWPSSAWPTAGARAMEGSPPSIPHDLQMRGNCLACHAGPGAVLEIRTTHPERPNCRQCHLPAAASAEAETFTRPLDAGRPPSGGGS